MAFESYSVTEAARLLWETIETDPSAHIIEAALRTARATMAEECADLVLSATQVCCACEGVLQAPTKPPHCEDCHSVDDDGNEHEARLNPDPVDLLRGIAKRERGGS